MGRIKDLPTQARTVAADDFEDLDGATFGSRKITPQDKAGQLRNALAPRGGVAFDGTSDCGWAVALGSQSIGTDPFAIYRVFRVPSSTPSSFSSLACIGPSVSNNTANGSFSVRLGSNSGSVLDIALVNGSGQTRRLFYDIVGNYGGKVVHLVVVRPTSGEIQVFINAAQVTLTLNTGVASAQDSITSTYFYSGRSSQTNVFVDYGASLYNLALSASDALEIYELGGAVPERFKFGSQVAKNTSAFTNSGYDSFSGASATGCAAVKSITGAGTKFLNANPQTFYLAPRQQVKVKYDLTLNSGHVPYVGISGSAGDTAAVVGVSQTTVLTNASSGVQLAAMYFYNLAAEQADFVLANVSFVVLGAVVHLPLDDGIGYQLHDESTNNLDAAMTTAGVSHLRPQRRGFVRSTLTWAGTHEAKSLLGQDCLPLGAYLLLATVRPTASTSGGGMLFGTVNDNGRFVAAAVPLTANQKKPISLYTPVPLTGATVGGGHLNLAIDPDNAAYTGSITVETHYALTEGNP